MAGKNIKDGFIQIRISEDLKKQAQERAEEEGRSLSNYLIKLIQDDLKKSAE